MSELLVVGSRVHCILYGGRNGVIYQINGEQAPASVGGMAGVTWGGRASFDIVWEDGSESRGTPECIIRGVQWRILGEVVGADVIQFMREFAAVEQARQKAAREASACAFSNAVQALRADPIWAHLRQGDDKARGGKLVAINLRVELKRAFPGIKFSITSDYNSVRVSWQDGPTTKAVEAITGKYSGGYFDGMTDSYEHRRSPFTEVFGSAQYINENRHYTVATMQAAADFIAKRFGMAEPFKVEAHSDGAAWVSCDSNYHREIYDYLEQRYSYEHPEVSNESITTTAGA